MRIRHIGIRHVRIRHIRTQLTRLSLFVLLCGPALAHASARPTYYLALGDSLAQGVQPLGPSGQDVETTQGYVDDLFALLRTRMPALSLTKLGCPGETTSTMINGGVCTYLEGNQLAAAVSFLQAHHGQAGLVTLDIGANDIDGCFILSTVSIDPGCVTTALGSVASNLPRILTELRIAAGPNTLILAMNYYDPFLAAWKLLPPPNGPALAHASLQVATAFNGALETVYQTFDIPVADVASAYHISNFTLVPVVNLPVNVFLTLTWTWMGAPPPFGPNVHPNAAGYAVIAGAFAEKVATRPFSQD